MRRIGVMIGESAVDIAEQLDDLAAQATIELRGHRTGNTIAAVDRDLHRPGELDVSRDRIQIRRDDIDTAALPAPRRRNDATCSSRCRNA